MSTYLLALVDFFLCMRLIQYRERIEDQEDQINDLYSKLHMLHNEMCKPIEGKHAAVSEESKEEHAV